MRNGRTAVSTNSSFLIGAGFAQGKLVSGFRGQIDHLALWHRALSDDEAMALSGGREEAARRDQEILGPRKPVGQYRRPHGYNTSIGDCMAFAHDGTFHIFFISDRRHGGSKALFEDIQVRPLQEP
jgi:hypothetical protein